MKLIFECEIAPILGFAIGYEPEFREIHVLVLCFHFTITI